MRTNNSGSNLSTVEVLEGTAAADRSKSFIEKYYETLNPKVDTVSTTQTTTVVAPVKQTIQIKLTGQTEFADF